jgi:hypothetical protein
MVFINVNLSFHRNPVTIILKRMYWKITILGNTTIEYDGKIPLHWRGGENSKNF